ncbi:MAG: type II toxin-antitoxin system RnlB family antitoxin [Rhodoferax sp.]|nr:type II toxin-antitoxin system RnlB family antitoxin [Rhodoferax sp.]
MNKPFKVQAVKAGRIHAISFSLDSTRPEDYYGTLEKSLAQLKIEGEVLLDLLACNGQTSRRFFTVYFDGTKLTYQSMKVAKQEALEPSLLSRCSTFYANNVGKLYHTVLSTPARKKLEASPH